ncbi:SpoIIE family protein phosphatase [Lignipirellula cremea]|uniref:Phosphoserine phosphatase RsbU n=1 Tax=Lignipirellula cremea TaxID=2528010 RepID=A0A518E2E5_9BACT|nr:SpoIIE family protein phosphatase [Lignipirellula cremea]QDU98261.1 Phosphoserine phosphatase RsbU [Lignipirellula cremea]
MAKLIVQENEQTLSFPLRDGVSVVGRHPNSDIPIAQGTVSGKHALVIRDGDKHYLEDIGSRNGTFINDQKIEERTLLSHNDAIRFGQFEVRFECEASELPVVNETVTAQVEKPAAAPSATPPKAAPRQTPSPALPTVSFEQMQLERQVDFTNTGDEEITEAAPSRGRFGALETQPEAKLKAVLEISQNLAGSLSLEQMLPAILDTLFSIFRYADRGCILLRDSSGAMVPRAIKHRRAGEDASVRLSRTIVNKVLTEKVGVLSADAMSEFSASASISELNIRSMMCAPLLDLSGEPCGVISIDSQNPLGQFAKGDLDLLMAVAGQAALSYETARLMETFIAKQKQDGEMEIAQTVQRDLLPEAMPQTPGWQFYASYDTAQAVGGDYYDWFELPNKKVCLSFGDVAGKGVPGALIMARISSCVQSTIRHVIDPEQAVCAINDHMCDSRVEGRFVTYVLAMIDPETGEVELANAGHMSPLIRRHNGEIESFDEELVGPPIGVMDEYPYEVDRKVLQPGDMVVIVTDGVDEAMNPAGELYGTDRVIEFVKNGSHDAAELGKALLADVRRHAAGRAQNDDITIMTFGRNSTG